ncbi:trigger factor [Thermochromatium tepidum]|uniref:Trigger factor n=1 Tax=Thermochromatium tepidum ATCC 43061 TaxID=316276 RepID=A0A6I6EDB5_THETI|nr:trigger factor [Thermochromatium tepidum]QGU32949.1 trigger factor [Thermochromatium tepidum ATCC 43061]
MRVSVEAGEGLERRMRVDLPFDEVGAEVEKRLQQLARHAKLPGFRPGKVPLKVLRQRYNAELHQEVFGDMVQKTLYKAFEQESLIPAGLPQIEPDLDIAAGRMAYTAIFEVMPEIRLASVQDRVIKRPVCELTDADLDDMIQRLRAQRKTWEPVDRPAQQGDQLSVSFVVKVDGEPFEGSAVTDFKLELGSGGLIPGFEEGLIGATPGETRTLDLTFPEDHQTKPLAGKPARFEVTIDSIAKPRLPELDAEFVKGFGIEDGDLERFRADVRRNMERELKERLIARTKERVMDMLYEANPIELPRVLVESEQRTLAKQMRQALGGGQMSLPPERLESDAKRRVALGLILGQIIRDNDIKVDPERVRETVEHIASSYEHPQEVIDYYYADEGRLGPIRALVIEDQVVDLILKQARVEDEPLTFAQLTEQ